MLQKAVNQRVMLRCSFRLCVCSIPYLNSTTACASLSDTVVFYCVDEGEKGEGQRAGKVVDSNDVQTSWDSACGTGCLFNLARMWTMWGKIPEHKTGGPLAC